MMKNERKSELKYRKMYKIMKNDVNYPQNMRDLKKLIDNYRRKEKIEEINKLNDIQ